MKGRRETAFFFADQLRSGTERIATSSLEYAQPNRKVASSACARID
jgi:hypothetical protein